MKKQFYFLGLSGLLFLVCYETLNAQKRRELLHYLKGNAISLDIEKPSYDSLFTKDFYQNDVFLLGERHGILYSYDALLSYVKHLKSKTNFKYYLLETPLYWEIYLNKYFETGDESFLKKPFYVAQGTFYANQNFYDFYKNLYKLNQSLAPDDRIKFLSLDVEHQYKYSHAMLLDLLKKYKHTASGNDDFISYFFEKDPEKNNEYKKKYQLYQKKWDADISISKQTLGDDFEITDYLIRNINFKFLANDDPKDLARDSLMYENYMYRSKKLNFKQKKTFGFMGIDHCYTSSTPTHKYFGAYLSQNQLKVSSTIMLYANSETLIPNHYLPKVLRYFGGNDGYFRTKMRSNDRWIEYQKKIGVLKEVSKGKITLFRLNQGGSPFSNNAIFVDNLKTKQSTTNFMHYVILIQDSPAANMLKQHR